MRGYIELVGGELIMKLREITLSALVASSLISAPVVAQAAAADRSSTEVAGEELNGRWGIGLPIAVVIAILVAVIALTDDNDDNPISA